MVTSGGFIIVKSRISNRVYAIDYQDQDFFPPAMFDLLVWRGMQEPARYMSFTDAWNCAESLNEGKTLVLKEWLCITSWPMK